MGICLIPGHGNRSFSVIHAKLPVKAARRLGGITRSEVQSEMRMPFIAQQGQGSFYHKPVNYLAIALYESERLLAQIVKDLDVMMNLSKFIPS
jgi:hypothetical protein